MNSYKCVIADKDLIIKKWDCEIKKHNNSKLWIQFKKESLKNLDTRIVYMGLLNGEIITEATAIVSEYDFNMQNKDVLIGDKKAYLTAFRTNKEYENKGYFSKLYKFMENDLKKRGFKYLTLGVEPCEIRNIQIYFKWGFIKYIKTDYDFVIPGGESINQLNERYIKGLNIIKDNYNYNKVAIISHGAAISNIKSKLSGEKYEDVDYCVIIYKNNKYRVIDYGTYN